MFSLIITVISIVLVIALAVATIYYGGDTSSRAAARVTVGTLVNMAAQINAAGTIATSQGPGWPDAAPIFTQPFLANMPVPPKSAYVDGITPSATDWEYYLADHSSHHFVLRNKIRSDICLAINREMGIEGIPAAWDGTSLIQCYGTGTTVPGAYTFFFDPPGGTSQAQKDAALAQSMTEAGTTTPGYPRLCADNTSITSGLCPSSSPLPNNGGAGGGTPPPTDDWTPGTATWDEGDAPTEDDCADTPDIPTCDASRYSALAVRYVFGSRPIKFTAVPDCSHAVAENYICLPRFRGQVRTWRWAPPPEASVETSQPAFDGRLAWKNSTDEAVTISDGKNTYNIYHHRAYGTQYIYEDIQQFAHKVSSKHAPAISWKCSQIETVVTSKGGYFLPNKCDTIETAADYSYVFFFNDYGQFNADSPLNANPTFRTDYQSWGVYDQGYDNSFMHMRVHGQTGVNPDYNPFMISAYPQDISEETGIVVRSGSAGPVAPLQTDLSNEAY